MKTFSLLLLALHLSLLPAVCTKILKKKPDTTVYPLRGQIVSIDSTKQILTLTHEEIPQYLNAITTEFHFRHSYIIPGLSAGKTVEGTLVVSREESWIESISVVAQEPKHGKIGTLVFFDEDFNPLTKMSWYTIGNLVRTNKVAKVGSFSLGGDWGDYAGVQVGLAHPDSVFWVHENSRLQFWTKTDNANNAIHIWAKTYGGTNANIIDWFKPGNEVDSWNFVDIPLPKELRNMPITGFEIGGPGVTHKRYIDDLRITNARINAGAGEPPIAAMDYIAASQIGYTPAMKKEFTSPLNFASFTIVRVSDNAVVFTGGPPEAMRKSGLIATTAASVYIGNFSAFSTPGRYKIIAGKKESLPFNIGDSVFNEPLKAAQRMLYYQRAFTAIEEPFAEQYWIHPSDSDKAPEGVIKGWHDAGDLTVYMPTVCQTLYWLLEAYNDFQPNDDDFNIPESNNGIPDLLDESRWGLEWILSMQDNNTNHTGGFWGTACVSCNNKHSAYGKTTPNTVDQYCKVHPPTVQNTAKAVAVLAYASVIFQRFDKNFSATCLSAARNGWSWMQTNPNATSDGNTGCDSYAQGGDQVLLKTNRSWADASLFHATGDQIYNDAFLRDYVPTDWISSFSKTEAFANRTYLRATGGDNTLKSQIREGILSAANGVRNDANNHPYQCAIHYYWGSSSNALHRTGQFSWPAYLLDKKREADRDAGFDNLHYLFGRNYLNICYVSGAYRWGATRYRKEGFHHWMKTLNNPDSLFHFPGALAGGPNESPDFNDRSYPMSNPYPTWGYSGDLRGATASRINNIRDGRTPVEGRFTDNDSWCTNEIVISWNAVFLYNLYAARAAAAR